MTKIESVWIGENSLLIGCAETWLERGHLVSAVITPSAPIRRWCEARDVPCFGSVREWLREAPATPDSVLWSVTNLDVLPDAMLARPWRVALNFHDGPLPQYAGLNTPVWALTNGATAYGISWHTLTPEVDRGAVLESVPIEVVDDETALTLNAKCFEAGFAGFERVVDRIESGDLAGEATGEPERVYRRRQKPPACAGLGFDRPAADVAREVRALDHGPYANPVGRPRIDLPDGGHAYALHAEPVTVANGDPGTLIEVAADGWTVACREGSVKLSEWRAADGANACPLALAKGAGLSAGSTLPAIDEAARAARLARLESFGEDERRWVRRLEAIAPTAVPFVQGAAEGSGSWRMTTLSTRDPERWTAAWTAWLHHAAGAEPVECAAVVAADADADTLGWRPARFRPRPDRSIASYREHVSRERLRLRNRAPLPLDLGGRHPGLGALDPTRCPIELRLEDADAPDEKAGAVLSFALRGDGKATMRIRENTWDAGTLARAASQLETLADQLDRADGPLARTSLLSEQERSAIFEIWNDTAADYDRDACVHRLFEEQVARTPDAPALACRTEELTYAELNRRANAVARRLIDAGVGPDALVAVCVDRSVEMMLAILGVLKAGGAYVPVDPTYPADRIDLMLEDSGARWVLTRATLAEKLPATGDESGRETFHVESIVAGPDDDANPETGVAAANLAYVIYTSGSTGRPKGVQVEHRNVVNFFAGMDEFIPHEPPGVWLAVTSLSFDISVLELFWTLARGFKVVLFGDETKTLKQARTSMPERPIDFNLFYFSSDASEKGVSEKYKLLLEGAKFGDAHGFNAVWTPERHFHAFGGLYPNPSVAAAALATITENVQLRAGSCVLPLHHPARVAEEWSVVDNLSNGRVGISFASGWQPNDFCLRPESHARAKEIMVENIDVVRKLWRGETVTFPGPKGDVEVATLPRPVQAELPFWVTAAGNPETFRIAGEQGANMLTHLLGQSLEELAEKIAVYREAWSKAGHPGKGIVSLMLHTFVAPDEEYVREMVKEPLKDYLRSAAGLIAQYASSFPTFKNLSSAERADLDFKALSDEDMDALLDHSVARYYETSGLFGTPESCVAFVDGVKRIDVDEIACLIDFGVPSEAVLENLPSLARLRERCQAGTVATDAAGDATHDGSLAAEIRRHGVTHLQCTPSMATMFTLDPPARQALAGIDVWMIGGEAFPHDLAKTWLETPERPEILNMYGPTETTIWSAVERLERDEGFVSIGRPIANTRLYVLDAAGRPLPAGVAGELYIAGDGVVRGYKDRLDLTAERFVDDPFANGLEGDRSNGDGEVGARMYRTGDLAQWLPDGRLKFLGRVDHQIKLRGYRIELGEIEETLRAHDAVAEAAVVLREDTPGDKRLVGYVTGVAAGGLAALETWVKERLPEFMVPAHLLAMDRLPLTPNRKIDRNALPSPAELAAAEPSAPRVPPGNETETIIAEVWKDALSIADVSVEDNFFDLGGHSLLTVQVLNRLRERTDATLQMTDLFRFPTIRSLAAFMVEGGAPSQQTETAASRGAARRSRMGRRRRPAS